MSEPTELEIETNRADTLAHIQEVGKNLNFFIRELIDRAEKHDASKLESPELEGYAKLGARSKLQDMEYGSEAYKKNLEDARPTIEHHYARNRHHVQHWPEGINNMTLIDLLEMLADWKAAALRNKNGNLRKSLEVNADRYKIGSQLRQIFENTIREHFPD